MTTKNHTYLTFVEAIDAYGTRVFAKPWHKRSAQDEQAIRTITTLGNATAYEFTGIAGELIPQSTPFDVGLLLHSLPTMLPPANLITAFTGDAVFVSLYTQKTDNGYTVSTLFFPATILTSAARLLDPVAKIVLTLDLNGRLQTSRADIELLQELPQTLEAELRDACDHALWTVAFGFALTHCQNVKESRILPPRPVRRFRERKGLPALDWQTVNVTPAFRAPKGANEKRARDGMKAVFATYGVRGQFRGYGDEWKTKPLYGEYEGLYYLLES